MDPQARPSTAANTGKPPLQGLNGRILVVDDELHSRNILREALESMNHQVSVAEKGTEALAKLRSEKFDILITDLSMPGMDGIQLLEKALDDDSSLSVIVVTAHGTIETAVEAMKKGAEDYLLKPIEFSALELMLKRVFSKRLLLMENRKLQRENESLRQNLGLRYHLTGAIGKSAPAQALLEKIQSATQNRAPLLIVGETGVGRDDIARMVHYNSSWAANDLIVFDCASVPEDLQERHLFGEDDPTSGAGRAGLLEKAHMGTLVLLHLQRLGPKSQSRLSWVLTENKTQRVGGKRFYAVDVRIIATSDLKDLERATSEGKFRPDVQCFFMDNQIQVPPLRERKEDIPVLAAIAARQICTAMGKEPLRIDQDVLETLQEYDFPGNGRELRSIVESAVIRCTATTLRREDFSFSLAREKAPTS